MEPMFRHLIARILLASLAQPATAQLIPQKENATNYVATEAIAILPNNTGDEALELLNRLSGTQWFSESSRLYEVNSTGEVEYRERDLQPGGTWRLNAVFGAHQGDWHAALEAYRNNYAILFMNGTEWATPHREVLHSPEPVAASSAGTDGSVASTDALTVLGTLSGEEIRETVRRSSHG